MSSKKTVDRKRKRNEEHEKDNNVETNLNTLMDFISDLPLTKENTIALKNHVKMLIESSDLEIKESSSKQVAVHKKKEKTEYLKCQFTEIEPEKQTVFQIEIVGDDNNDINFTCIEKWKDLFDHFEFKNFARLISKEDEKMQKTFQLLYQALNDLIESNFEEAYLQNYQSNQKNLFVFIINNSTLKKKLIDHNTEQLAINTSNNEFLRGFASLKFRNRFTLKEIPNVIQYFTFLHGRNRFFMVVFSNQSFHQIFQKEFTDRSSSSPSQNDHDE